MSALAPDDSKCCSHQGRSAAGGIVELQDPSELALAWFLCATHRIIMLCSGEDSGTKRSRGRPSSVARPQIRHTAGIVGGGGGCSGGA